jgi:hypothetical protein
MTTLRCAVFGVVALSLPINLAITVFEMIPREPCAKH